MSKADEVLRLMQQVMDLVANKVTAPAPKVRKARAPRKTAPQVQVANAPKVLALPPQVTIQPTLPVSASVNGEVAWRSQLFQMHGMPGWMADQVATKEVIEERTSESTLDQQVNTQIMTDGERDNRAWELADEADRWVVVKWISKGVLQMSPGHYCFNHPLMNSIKESIANGSYDRVEVVIADTEVLTWNRDHVH